MSNVPLTAEPPETDASSLNRERERIHRQMLSPIAHDLKTPLASIIGSLEIYMRMKDSLPAEKQATLIKVALQEAHRLDTFITNVLDMAKLESGLVSPQQESVEIGGLLRDCLTRMDYHLQDSTINIDPLSDTLKTVIDPVLLSRVVCLVLDNAVKYGGTPPVIQIRFGKDGNRLGYISLQDNGHGIPEDQTKDVFSKYSRFGKQGAQTMGMGLGLAITREIMGLLDGTITAANDPSGGAVFTLYFPIK